MRINSRGYWENPTAEGHGHDSGLAKALVEFFHKEPSDSNFLTVIDIGCGDGYYTSVLFDDYVRCIGFDGNPNNISNCPQVYPGYDFTMENSLGKYNWTLCLEVGEHIPAEFEGTFLDNLHKHNKDGMILSWAVRGQGGDGHVNCQDNWEIIQKIEPMGYTLDTESTVRLRQACAEYPVPCYWFRNTLMVFRRNK